MDLLAGGFCIPDEDGEDEELLQHSVSEYACSAIANGDVPRSLICFAVKLAANRNKVLVFPR